MTKAIGVSLLALLVASLAQAESIGAVFYIPIENHNWTQPASLTSPHPIYRNPAAPFINSLVTPGNANAANVSYASKYLNVVNVPCNQQLDWVHPSEPNYVWMEAGLAKLTVPLNAETIRPSRTISSRRLILANYCKRRVWHGGRIRRTSTSPKTQWVRSRTKLFPSASGQCR